MTSQDAPAARIAQAEAAAEAAQAAEKAAKATAAAASSPAAAPPVRFVGELRAFWQLLLRGAVLLMVTLGLYRFWLATDIRRFLWANTEIDGRAPHVLAVPRHGIKARGQMLGEVGEAMRYAQMRLAPARLS